MEFKKAKSSYFDYNGFSSYKLLKVMSRSRLHAHRRIQFGISVEEDNFRINIYHKPDIFGMETQNTLNRSHVFSLNFSKETSTIENTEDLAHFFSALNVILNVPFHILEVLYKQFIYSCSESSFFKGGSEAFRIGKLEPDLKPLKVGFNSLRFKLKKI
jgi:hypothetical protein